VAVDLDGTLLRSDGTVSDRTVAALRAAEAAGASVVLVTGRPPRFVTGLAARTGGHETVICANGGLVWDLSTGSAISVDGIDPGLVLAFAGQVRARVPGVVFAVEQTRGLSREPDWPTLDPRRDTGARVGPLVDLVDSPVVKLLVRGPAGTDVAALRAVVAGLAAERLEVTWSVPRDVPLVEVSAHGVDKGTALARLAAGLGIDAADAVAFGDMPNDVAMLQWAGIGVAMGQAHPDLVAVADRATASNDDDGVALVLEELFA